MNAAAHMFEEVAAPATSEERDAARALADTIAQGATDVVLLDVDGTEHALPAEDVRLLLAMIVARAQGQKVWVVAGEEQISPQRAAELLGVSRPMVYRLIERGDLDVTMAGTHQRLRVSEVLEVARRRARLTASVDEGFAAGREAGKTSREAAAEASGAKDGWRTVSEEDREAARERSRERAARRRARP